MYYEVIKKEDWVPYFNLLSKLARGRHIRLELIGSEIGDQIEEDWTLFEGLYFDMSDEILYVRTPLVEHSILYPQNIMIQEDGLLRALGIRDADGQLQIIHFRDPILLEGH
ncbi:MAG: DUF5335 family protein [Pseudobdellovibrionaceae bacterium]